MKHRFTFVVFLITAFLTAQQEVGGQDFGELALAGDGSVALRSEAPNLSPSLERTLTHNDSLNHLKKGKQSVARPVYVANYLNIYSDGQYRASLNTTSGAYVQEADGRHRKEVRILDDEVLEKVLELIPVTYLMKGQENQYRSYGLTAQDVADIFPTLVHYVPDQDIYSLSYSELVPVLVKALQEQQQTIENLRNNQFQMQRDLAVLQHQLTVLLGQINAATPPAGE